jgi:hypothetical protein
MTRDEIRAEYVDRTRDLEFAEAELDEAASRLEELEGECQHPHRGQGTDPFGFAVSEDECPDCGHRLDDAD